MKYGRYYFLVLGSLLMGEMIFLSPAIAQMPSVLPNEVKEALPDDLKNLTNEVLPIVQEIKDSDNLNQNKNVPSLIQSVKVNESDKEHRTVSPNDLVFPKLTGRVVDEANVLSPYTEKELTRLSETVEPFQLVVATVSSLNGIEIEEYGYRLGRYWQLGSKEKNDGILLLIAPNEKRIRIEVGYGLEGVITDAIASLITEKILKELESGQYNQALLTATNEIVQLLETEKEIFVQPEKKEGMPYGFVFSLITFIFFCYVAMAPSGQRGRRIRKLLFLFTLTGGIKGGFKGKGGSFGGGGATKRWK